MKQVKKCTFLLAALTGVYSTYADNTTLGTTNSLTMTTSLTNTFLQISQGTNTVLLPTSGTNVVVRIVQVPPPKPPLAPIPTYPWVSSIAAGFALTRGNSDTTLFTAKYGTQKKKENNEYIFGADGAYGDNNGTESQDTIHGMAQYNHLFSPIFYGFANADALHDGIQDLKYRLSLSPGVGYYFVKTKATTLGGEFGPGVVTEDRGNEDQTYASLRLSENFDQKLSQSARLWEKAELIPQINQLDNYIVNAEVGVETALTKRLSLQVIFDENYVNQPAAGREKNDIKLVSGIAYKF